MVRILRTNSFHRRWTTAKDSRSSHQWISGIARRREYKGAVNGDLYVRERLQLLNSSWFDAWDEIDITWVCANLERRCKMPTTSRVSPLNLFIFFVLGTANGCRIASFTKNSSNIMRADTDDDVNVALSFFAIFCRSPNNNFRTVFCARDLSNCISALPSSQCERCT